MGMYNAIIPDENMMPFGVFKERLSQSTLYAAMRAVPDSEAQAVRALAGRQGHAIPHRPGSPRPISPTRRFWISARCTSPPCASPTNSDAT